MEVCAAVTGQYDQFSTEDLADVVAATKKEENLLQQDSYVYISENDLFENDSGRLALLEPIASGCFGQVFVGLLDETKKVAVKMVKTANGSSASEENRLEQRESMRAELKIFAEINGHENFVALLGAVTTKQAEFCLVLEYCDNKGLDMFLTKRRAMFTDEIVEQKSSSDTASTQYKSEIEDNWANLYLERRSSHRLTTSDLLAFSLQVCQGLEFLHSKKIVHRDLALRNILLTKDFVVKIADFGLSRLTNCDRYDNLSNNKLPYKWLPKESLLSGSTSLKSDLWTFGILLWEMFTLHDEPYKGLNAHQYLAYIESGKRLDKPAHTPIEIYELMLELWNGNPELRPLTAHCQSVIIRQLRRSCPGLAEIHSEKHYECVIQEFEKETPNPILNIQLQSITESNGSYASAYGQSQVVTGRAWKYCPYFQQRRYILVAGTLILFGLLVAGGLVLVFRATAPDIKEGIIKPGTVVEYNGFEYVYKVLNFNSSWDYCKQVCADWNGTLVSIRSKEENDFVNTLHQGNCDPRKCPNGNCARNATEGCNRLDYWAWIGLRKPNFNGNFTWDDDNTVANFTAWDISVVPPQPNVGVKSFCASQSDYDGGWYNEICDIPYPYNPICKRKKLS